MTEKPTSVSQMMYYSMAQKQSELLMTLGHSFVHGDLWKTVGLEAICFLEQMQGRRFFCGS